MNWVDGKALTLEQESGRGLSSQYVVAGQDECRELRIESGWTLPGFNAEQSSSYLQVTACDVDEHYLYRLPGASTLTSLLARDYQVALTRASTSLVFEIESEGERYESEGVVIALRRVRTDLATSVKDQQQLEEVSEAAHRGLLDDVLYDRANFRLRGKAFLRDADAIAQSEYVPGEWQQFNLLFAQWRHAGTQAYVRSPLDHALTGFPGTLRFRLNPASTTREFRLSDLFSN